MTLLEQIQKNMPLLLRTAENFMRMMCSLRHCFCILIRSLLSSAEIVCRRILPGLFLILEEENTTITRKTAGSGKPGSVRGVWPFMGGTWHRNFKSGDGRAV